ncbi:MAG: metalloregulator ArsR/SmtB family transcription factor [Acidobacteria bacterium]|nr:metalloregulator ArsR/SmtB family transcription factor [Acidobacteriota bacterium]
MILEPAARARPAVFDRMSALADPIRCRLLQVLEGYELTVSELCSVLQLPQSTVSRHLKVLSDGDWLVARREGTSRLYALRREQLDTASRSLWALVREQLGESVTSAQDRRRLEEVLRQRRTKSREFFSTSAGQWAALRREMFGNRFDLQGLLGLLDPTWVVGDLGSGTGQTAQALAPFVRWVIIVDDSEAMVEAARTRLEAYSNVDLRRGALESLPIPDGELDAAVLVLVLHYLPDPLEALREALRALRPGGRLLVVDMLPHDHEEYLQQMGHIWLGFSKTRIGDWLSEAGFEGVRFIPLAVDPDAKGPSLFAASAGVPNQASPFASNTHEN